MTRILCFVGSLRKQASSGAVARAILSRLPKGVSVEYADIGVLPHYNADHDGGADVARLIEQIRTSDGVLFVTPEYNYSVPGVLKNALDWASRPAYQSVFGGKDCFIVSTSGGVMGGVRAQSHLKYILNAMLAEVFPWQEIVVPEAPKKLTDGVFDHAPTLDFASTALAVWLERISSR